MKIGVVGLGAFGSHLVKELAELGVEVLAVDNREAAVDAVKGDAAHAAVVDVTDRAALARLPFQDLDAVVVTIGEDFRSAMLATAHLLALRPRRLICRAASETHEQLLRALNIDEVVLPEAVAAARVATSLALRGVTGSYELSEHYRILEVTAPPSAVGRNLFDLALRKKHDINLVTVKRRDPRTGRMAVVGVIPPDFVFEAGDILVLFGAQDRFKEFLER